MARKRLDHDDGTKRLFVKYLGCVGTSSYFDDVYLKNEKNITDVKVSIRSTDTLEEKHSVK